MANIDTNKFNTLGIFYQDPLTVRYGSKEGDTTNNPQAYSPRTSGELWGFRFLFNPTSWSYSLSVDSSIDWTNPGDTNAILVSKGIGGNMSITILLDRVADMNDMRTWYNKGMVNNPGPPYYPYVLSTEQCLGILNRGTEYDLEYLYRVINGDPQTTDMIGTGPSGYDNKSANLGYLAGLPFMFKIHDNQKYRVMIANISVQHDMFTREMIPIRSLLNLTLERLPDFSATGESQNLDKFTDVAVGVSAASTDSGVSRTVSPGSGLSSSGYRGGMIAI